MENFEKSLHDLILSRYKSLHEFSRKIGMPHSTVVSIFKRGIDNSSVTNIIKICKALGISADSLANGEISTTEKPATENGDGRTETFANIFQSLTPENQELIVGTMRAMQRDK